MKVNEANINRAIKVLELVSDDQLNMRMYLTSEETPECGVVACVIGHLVLSDEFEKEVNEIININRYIKKISACDDFSGVVFGINDDDDDEYNMTVWNYLFSSEWSKHNNTIKGAIVRLGEVRDGFVPTEKYLPWSK